MCQAVDGNPGFDMVELNINTDISVCSVTNNVVSSAYLNIKGKN